MSFKNKCSGCGRSKEWGEFKCKNCGNTDEIDEILNDIGQINNIEDNKDVR